MIAKRDSTKDRAYREFACWAVRRAWKLTPSKPWKDVVAEVERFLRGEVAFSTIRKLEESRRSAAGGVWACGISRGAPTAAVQLAAIATTGDSARESARTAIDWLALAAGFRALGPPSDVEGSAAGFRAGGPYDRARVSAEAKAERAFLEGELQRWLDRAATGSSATP